MKIISIYDSKNFYPFQFIKNYEDNSIIDGIVQIGDSKSMFVEDKFSYLILSILFIKKSDVYRVHARFIFPIYYFMAEKVRTGEEVLMAYYNGSFYAFAVDFTHEDIYKYYLDTKLNV